MNKAPIRITNIYLALTMCQADIPISSKKKKKNPNSQKLLDLPEGPGK